MMIIARFDSPSPVPGITRAAWAVLITLTSALAPDGWRSVQAASAPPGRPVYTNDFTTAEIGKVPEDFLVLDGQFVVAGEGTEKYLELPGSPLETFGVLFGPSEKGQVAVAARIYATSKGRRFPTFGVSVGGMSGYRVLIAPAKKTVELAKGDGVVASAPFEWTSGQWARFLLVLQPGKTGGWLAQAKVWMEAQTEPADWTVTAEDKSEPVAGRCGIWGQPFSGTPIRFDDLRVMTGAVGSP
jgi:hypothetical protein